MAKRKRTVHPVIEELRARRKAWRLTQTAVAARSGVSFRCISNAELGERSPTLRNIARIAEALGCEIVLKPSDLTR